MTTIEAKIRSFSELERGWHYGEGGPPTPEMVERAVKFSRFLEDYATGYGSNVTLDAFPGIAGEIQIVARQTNMCSEYTLELDGTIHLSLEEDGKIIATDTYG